MEEAVSRFGGTLGYRPEGEAIDDPVQTARVRFLRLPGGSSWLELVAPLGSPSKLDAALARGGGLHHLCYEVGDLPAACERLRAGGFALISGPEAARAFPGRRIAWLMDRARFLLELVESGPPPYSVSHLLADAASR
jgi:methylmalonyl-CoA/ethylmalonyl-CoA epimerase